MADLLKFGFDTTVLGAAEPGATGLGVTGLGTTDLGAVEPLGPERCDFISASRRKISLPEGPTGFGDVAGAVWGVIVVTRVRGDGVFGAVGTFGGDVIGRLNLGVEGLADVPTWGRKLEIFGADEGCRAVTAGRPMVPTLGMDLGVVPDTAGLGGVLTAGGDVTRVRNELGGLTDRDGVNVRLLGGDVGRMIGGAERVMLGTLDGRGEVTERLR